jgi:hypothetical protein
VRRGRLTLGEHVGDLSIFVYHPVVRVSGVVGGVQVLGGVGAVRQARSEVAGSGVL